MERERTEELWSWVTNAGLEGAAESDLLREFCERAVREGIPLSRALVIVDTLHPVYEGRVFRWRSEPSEESEVVEYGRTSQPGEAADNWRKSPFFHMLQTGQSVMRRRLLEDGADEFPVFRELYDAQQTDWMALIHRFKPGTAIGEMDCIYSSWVTDAPGGWDTSQIYALKRLVPSLKLAIKSASLNRIAETLVQTYLGRDAGRRVLGGRIERGVADRIEAALWFSDLRSYTRITGAAPPETIIPLLNDYADAIISAIHEAGGDVLKLIGDGTLAIFSAENRGEACRAALRAESLARERIAETNARRLADGLPVTQAYLGLHVGEVFYGNIGSQDRLDFTVVGPAVNEAARIAAMCRSADRDVLVSAAFRDAALDEDRDCLVSVGRYALRGVERPQELFTRVVED